ncbi:MAG: DUF2802 domain-containing protein, partial [Clostridia bacterium]|nr:DUF2802 domain-containing protein [Clostridia bacterium]
LIVCLIIAVICTACNSNPNDSSITNSGNSAVISGNESSSSGNNIVDSVVSGNEIIGSGSDDSTNASGNENDNKLVIKSISIDSDATEVDAEKSLSFNIVINDDTNIDTSYIEFDTMITVGFDYCTALDNNILIKANTPDNQEITFYVKYESIKSEKFSFTVKNPRLVLENKIKQQEDKLAELQQEYNTLYSQAMQAKQSLDAAERDYNNYQLQCRNMGYLSAQGIWSSDTPSSVRIQSDRLFSNYREADYRFSQLGSLVNNKNGEINSVKATIASLKAELAEM